MKAFTLVLLITLLVSCATRSTGYKQLPEQFLSIAPSTGAETFVFQISPPFQDPVGFRFEFFGEDLRHAVKTSYSYRGPITRNKLSAERAKRIRAVLLAFDWNQVPDPKYPGVIQMVPDDIGILFRARVGGVYHEAVIGLSESSAIERLLREIGVIE